LVREKSPPSAITTLFVSYGIVNVVVVSLFISMIKRYRYMVQAGYMSVSLRPLVNGLVYDDVIDCLKLIASTYKDVRTRTKYVKALTYIGANVKKWIGRRAGAYLRNQADLIHKKLLAFLCRNGWIVVDLSHKSAYACIKQDDGYHFVRFGYFDYTPIILADILPELRHDISSIKRLLGEECYEATNTHWLTKFILELIPKEWWKPLDIDALILEYQLKQLP